MIPGIDRLRRAGDLLKSDGDDPDRAKLLAAATEVWSAMFDSHRWPEELRSRAASLEFHLFRHGRISETVERADEPEACRLRRELLVFADAAGRLPRHDSAAKTIPVTPSTPADLTCSG